MYLSTMYSEIIRHIRFAMEMSRIFIFMVTLPGLWVIEVTENTHKLYIIYYAVIRWLEKKILILAFSRPKNGVSAVPCRYTVCILLFGRTRCRLVSEIAKVRDRA